MKKDLTEIAENVTAWLYVMVLQGCPQISIKKGMCLIDSTK